MSELSEFLKRASKVANRLIKQLRLEDWEIWIFEDPSLKKPAVVETESTCKRAWIYLNPQHDEWKLHSLEENIRHELLHVHLSHLRGYLEEAFQATAQDQFDALMAGLYYVEEVTVENLNKIFQRRRNDK